ncbi:MAG: S49 family peptidase, partial [Pseudomonadota bacterium]
MADTTKKSWVSRIPIFGERLADRLQDVPSVAVLRLGGVIGQAGPARRGGLTLADQAETIEKAFKVPRVKAVALAINSPGG